MLRFDGRAALALVEPLFVVGLVFFFSYGFWKSNPDEVAMVVDPPGLAEYP